MATDNLLMNTLFFHRRTTRSAIQRACVTFLGGLLIACMPWLAQAQNILDNSYFNTDTKGWITTPEAQWSDSLNFMQDENDHGGALHVAVNGSMQRAEQCVPVERGSDYLFDMYALRDFSLSGYPGADIAGWFFFIEYRTGDGCDDSNSTVSHTVFGYKDEHGFGWKRQTVPLMSIDADHLLIAIGTESATTTAPVFYYFDAVTLTPDRIFSSGFE